MEFRYYTHHPMVDYVNSMDPGMYGHDLKDKPSISVKDIGMSVPMGISAQNVAGIYSKIRMGAGSIEIGFPGMYTGNRQAQTPEMYGEDQRQAIRELANINEIKLTTHAAYNVMGMMGRDPRDNFSTNNAAENMREIERAIDFAADTAGGGSVVVHTGEWERPFTDITVDDATMKKNLSFDPETGRLLFKRKHHEPADANFVLLDDRTSQKMETVHKDRIVSVPKWRRAEKDMDGYYQDNITISDSNEKWMENYIGKRIRIHQGDYIDYEGKKIINPYDPKYGRVPVFNEKSNRFEVEYKDFDDFKKEAMEQTEFNKKHWTEIKGKGWGEDDRFYYDGEIHPDEAFIHATLETNEGHSRGWALQYAERTQHHLNAIEKLKKAREFYEKLDKEIPEEDKWKIMKQDQTIYGYTHGLVPPETKNPLEMIDKAIQEQRVSLEFARQASVAQQQQAEDTAETKRHIVTPVKRFKWHAARYYGMAGLRAMERSKDPNDPVFLALENIFPERFGGHPEELKFIIDEARKWMVKLISEPKIPYGTQNIDTPLSEINARELTENPFYKGMGKEEAEKLAEKHIRATFDTGHANMWRKYWQRKPGQTIEESEEDFKKWYLKEFEGLVKKGYIGNIHLTDNFGFQDDHIAPGQGNVPVKEIMDVLKKYGYDKAITVEPGADASTDLSDFHGLMKTWRYLGSPIYGIGGGGWGRTPQTWGTVQYSYFGQNAPPYYIFGAYAPSNDWTLWSQVPLE